MIEPVGTFSVSKQRPCRAYMDPTYSGRERITCNCGKTQVRQPYMTESYWGELRRKFLSVHGVLAPDAKQTCPTGFEEDHE